MLAAILSGAADRASFPALVNGLLIAHLQIPPFIGTLGMYGVARGAAYLFAGGMTVADRQRLVQRYRQRHRFSASGAGASSPRVACLVLHYMLSQTRFGQHTYALGASKAAANRAGIDIKAPDAQDLSALGGHGGHRRRLVHRPLHRRRGAGGRAAAARTSIAAVVIGGASLFGGSGTIWGTIAGALVIAVIQYGLVFINVEPFWQFIAVGAVIIISVLVDQTQRHLMGGAAG